MSSVGGKPKKKTKRGGNCGGCSGGDASLPVVEKLAPVEGGKAKKKKAPKKKH